MTKAWALLQVMSLPNKKIDKKLVTELYSNLKKGNEHLRVLPIFKVDPSCSKLTQPRRLLIALLGALASIRKEYTDGWGSGPHTSRVKGVSLPAEILSQLELAMGGSSTLGKDLTGGGPICIHLVNIEGFFLSGVSLLLFPLSHIFLAGIPRSVEVTRFLAVAASLRVAAVYQQSSKGVKGEKGEVYMDIMKKYFRVAMNHAASKGALEACKSQKVVLEEYASIASSLMAKKAQISKGSSLDPQQDALAFMKSRCDLLRSMFMSSLEQIVSCRKKRGGLKSKREREESEGEEKRLVDLIFFCLDKLTKHYQFLYIQHRSADNLTEVGEICGEAAYVFAVGSAWAMTPYGALHPKYSENLKMYLAAMVKRSGSF